MGEDTIETGVDKLLGLFHGNERISIGAAAKRLALPEEVVQSWVDFLVEERVIGLEYKFAKQYIYLNRVADIRPAVVKEEKPSLSNFKQEFYTRAKAKHLPESKIGQFWRDHLRRELDELKDYFMAESKRRKFMERELLWEKYVAEVQNS